MNKELWKEKTKGLFNINQWTLFWCIYDEKDKEIERLKNVINELEKWLKEENYKNEDFWCINSVEVLNKLKELKEGK